MMLKHNLLNRPWKTQIIRNNNCKNNYNKKKRLKEIRSNNKHKIKKKWNKLNWKRKKIKLDY